MLRIALAVAPKGSGPHGNEGGEAEWRRKGKSAATRKSAGEGRPPGEKGLRAREDDADEKRNGSEKQIGDG
jgi:hypothetical protein